MIPVGVTLAATADAADASCLIVVRRPRWGAGRMKTFDKYSHRLPVSHGRTLRPGVQGNLEPLYAAFERGRATPVEPDQLSRLHQTLGAEPS